MARGLEDESYRRWLEYRAAAPGRWRRDEAFSQVLYLTPDEIASLAEVIRVLIAQYRRREARPAARPPEAAPVAIVARLFPLLEPCPGRRGLPGEPEGALISARRVRPNGRGPLRPGPATTWPGGGVPGGSARPGSQR